MTSLDRNERFLEAMRLLEETDRSLFITGRAGTGKSTLLSHFCETTRKKPAVLAPTGVAALNVRGQTIHNFFRFRVDVTPEKVRRRESRPRDAKLYSRLRTIVIDEVSMLRADLLDCVDAFLRLYGPDAKRPFGGVQMVFVGDLYQLPPVVTGPERPIFTTHYETPYFFSAHALRGLELEIVELERVYRQRDPDFISLLNRVRNNSAGEADIERLNTRFQPDHAPSGAFHVSLTTTNRKADEINEAHLAALRGRRHSAKARIKGDFGTEYYPTATELRFKPGAQVMMVNNDADRRWVNGSIGVIQSLERDEGGERHLVIGLQGGGLVAVHPHTWEVYRFTLQDGMLASEPVGTFTQFPFRLAWAVTIHKSQGKTFERIVIDLDRGTFAPGQMYVALSRCTAFEGIVLRTPIRKSHIRVDHRISAFMTGYRYRRSEAELSLEGKVELIRRAMAERRELALTYLKANDTQSRRIVIPLAVGTQEYRGKEFPGLKAFCTWAQEERMFRVDRILRMEMLPLRE